MNIKPLLNNLTHNESIEIWETGCRFLTLLRNYDLGEYNRLNDLFLKMKNELSEELKKEIDMRSKARHLYFIFIKPFSETHNIGIEEVIYLTKKGLINASFQNQREIAEYLDNNFKEIFKEENTTI